MANPQANHLDDHEERFTGARRIALFGHRDVGKTTLLAMFYRQASAGQVPGLRLAAGDAASAEYLAEKIAQIESGLPPAGTLAETELRLRLYHGAARFDLIVKDYQGEHVTLGSEEPIQAFFADCDAVFLCLDPEGSSTPTERRRRQQEIENLLERYIDKSADGTAGRPVALLLTKFDRVLSRALGTEIAPTGDPATWNVEALVDRQYGMTRHTLLQHAPKGAIFAVSAYGQGSRDGRPPAELNPLGLEGPLAWLAEQLESTDEEQLEWLWELCQTDLPRLERCVAAYERRYPKSRIAARFRSRLGALKAKRRRRILFRGAAAASLFVLGLVGYDALAFQQALTFERDNAPPAVSARWDSLLAWHPTLGVFWPAKAKAARAKQAEWAVKSAAVQVANGTANPNLSDKLAGLKDQSPALAAEIRKVEAARELAKHDDRWKVVKAEANTPTDDIEPAIATVRGFLKDFPDTPRRAEAVALLNTLKGQQGSRKSERERRIVDDLIRAEGLPNAELRDLIDRAQQFLGDHADSALRPEVEQKLNGYVKALDARDIDRARQYSKQYPTNFPTRIERYQDYLRSHQTGGQYISEAVEAKDKILREWDVYTYRLAYDHLIAHPDDIAEVAKRLRDYLRDHRDGRYARDAQRYLAWWDKVSVPNGYHVKIRRGSFDASVAKYLSGGGPDLGVEIEVGGITHGPSPVVPNNYDPIWDYDFPQPIKWKLGDPVTIRVIDHDWSDSVVKTITSRKGDPLALRNISGPVKSSKGAPATLVFESDFVIPKLTKPEE